jgi:hypothetical protein
MEKFSSLPWWGQVVFIAANGWIILILGILIRQVITLDQFHISNFFTKKKTESSNKRAKEYGRGHSGYIDA